MKRWKLFSPHSQATTTLTLPKIKAAVDKAYRGVFAKEGGPSGAEAVRLIEQMARSYGYGDDCLRGGRRRL